MGMIMLAVGYRGDVQPLVALAAGLRDAGHEIAVATHGDFEGLVRDAGLPFRLLPGRVAQFVGGPAGAALRDRLADPQRFARYLESYLYPYLEAVLDAIWEVSRDADAILGFPWLRMMPSLAERRGVPCFLVAPYPLPYVPTRAFRNPYLGDGPLAPPVRSTGRTSWASGRRIYTSTAQPVIDRWRERTLGLRPQPCRDELRALRRMPHLLGYSPTVLPRPGDWPARFHVTGFWVLPAPADYRPPPGLERFLDEGPPPVAFSFSSQVGRQPKELTAAVMEALRRTGRRGLLLSGWGGLRPEELPPGVFLVPSVPHDWLLPRLAGFVHHGGCGSMAAGLRAGVPSVAVTFGFDQPLWGERMARLGVGPVPMPAESLTADVLAPAIDRLVADPSYRERARSCAAALREEDGVANAVSAIQAILSRWTPCTP